MKTQNKTIRNTNCEPEEQYRLFKKSVALRRRINNDEKNKSEKDVIKTLASKLHHCSEDTYFRASRRLVYHQKNFARNVRKQVFDDLLEAIEVRNFPNFDARDLFVKQFFSNAGLSSKEVKRLQKEYKEYFCNQEVDKAFSSSIMPILQAKPISNFRAFHIDTSNLKSQLLSAGLPKSKFKVIEKHIF